MTGTEIIVVVGVTAIAAMLKSITGLGYPLVLVPALALFIDVAEAIVIVAPSNVLLNLQQIYKLRSHHQHAATLPKFLLGAAVGAVVGTLLLSFVPDRSLRIVLAVVIILFLINRLTPRKLTLSEQQGEQWAAPVGVVAGLVHGSAGISGPIVTPWFLSLHLDRDTFIYAISMTFGLSGAMQIVVLGVQGLFTWTLFTIALVLIPVGFVVFPLGAFIRDRISVAAFERIVLILLAGSAISLLVRVL